MGKGLITQKLVNLSKNGLRELIMLRDPVGIAAINQLQEAEARKT